MRVLSTRLRHAIKLSPVKQYLLARQVGIHNTTLSHWLMGVRVPKPDDPRVLALGRILDVPPDELFEQREECAS